ncbi:hypothetical protein T439DRAFT_330201 [Meredithblackwellia eburnea MCA 4105]
MTTPAVTPLTGAVPPVPSKEVTTTAETTAPILPAKHADASAPVATNPDGAQVGPDSHVLPLGSATHPQEQADVIADAPDGLVDAQVEKVMADRRDELGHEPRGKVVDGLEDDVLWAMMRRFNTQINHTLSPPTKLPPGEPDLRPSTLPEVPFNSDILRSNAERVFATAGVWSIYASREALRLMSWDRRERLRTGLFCTGYFISAYFSLVIPTIVLLLILLTTVPKSRKFLFPPVPPPPGVPASATDPLNKKGDESALAGVGHPIEHRSKAEQVEQQAWEFTNAVQRFGMRVVVGGRGKGAGNGEVGRKVAVDDDDDDDSADSGELDGDNDDDEDEPARHAALEHGELEPTDKDGKPLTAKQKRKLKAKEAREKRDAAVGAAAKAAQDGLGGFADTLEVFANALSPPKCYPMPHPAARVKLASAILLPIFVVTAVVPAHIWAQVFSYAFGFGFFGQPLIKRGITTFVTYVPDWQEKLDLRNSIFSKVPTNAQLVLYLARVAESEYEPLPSPPPPPTSKESKNELAKTGVDVEAEQGITDGVAGKDSTSEGDGEGDQPSLKHKVAAKGTKKFLGGLRLAAKKAATFRGDVQIADARQKVGNKIDRVFYQSRAKDTFTPEEFPAKLDGTSGHIVIAHSPEGPATVSFRTLRKPDPSAAPFEAQLVDLVEVKKHGVFIARAVLGWAAAINLEGMGLEMRFKTHHERLTDGIGKGEDPHEETHEGQLWTFSHVARRDELFLRLLAIGGQKWETL